MLDNWFLVLRYVVKLIADLRIDKLFNDGNFIISVKCYGFLDNELLRLLGVALFVFCKKDDDVGD